MIEQTGDTRRSVVFLQNNYYHFYYLARALRKRGWNAILVSIEDPDGPFSDYFHGEDVNLFSPDPVRFEENIDTFYKDARGAYRFLHFTGDGCMSFFRKNYSDPDPWDILEWKTGGGKLAYTVSGCLSGVAQSSVARWSASSEGGSCCDRCIWQNRPGVCSDKRNLAWGRKIEKHCDIIFAEGLPALDYMGAPRVIREPTTMALDPDFWSSSLSAPPEFRIEKAPGEVLIYHAMANYDLRTDENGKNIKGTRAILDAIDRLKQEGEPVRHVFVKDMKNTEVRFIQAQADIIVDQLNLGRYGATAREGMMLGKPVICNISPREPKGVEELMSINEVPLVNATEESVYHVLKELVADEAKRRAIGAASRRYALKWHCADACAERYEAIYDQIMGDGLGAYPYPYSHELASIRS